jgi:hypothetical protein
MRRIHERMYETVAIRFPMGEIHFILTAER